MKEIILCKYGEIILKGANKASFESLLLREVKRRAKAIGNFSVRYMQSTVFVEPLDKNSEEMIDDMYDQIRHVFGFAGICKAAACEKNMDSIIKTAVEYLQDKIPRGAALRAEARRSDKKFPLSSPEIAAEVGGAILDARPDLKVDLKHPDVTVRIEIRDREAYIHAGQEKGAGGIPAGSAGKGLLLLSGGIDSPVAGYMMMRRGLALDALHFESFPYTSELAREKVMTLASELTEFSGKMRVHVISLTKIQEEIRDRCNEEYFTLILRRFMMRLASMCAAENYCSVIVTGESLGQVASQTLPAMCATEAVAEIPVFRPCIGMDKDDIVSTARAIGTFETSILPYEDCCTVFTPKHPKTRPEIEKIIAEEAKLDYDTLLNEAWESRYCVIKNQFEA
ncbi:MAG: tRNA 4-thiouridine(8) synthase ThiI [Clostridiales bacterium]|nr:tRNA 4-thiouridine(8) synthase ThiI [Clostridiales bacterium]